MPTPFAPSTPAGDTRLRRVSLPLAVLTAVCLLVWRWPFHNPFAGAAVAQRDGRDQMRKRPWGPLISLVAIAALAVACAQGVQPTQAPATRAPSATPTVTASATTAASAPGSLAAVSTGSALASTGPALLFLGNKNIAPVVYLAGGTPAGLAVDIVRALATHMPRPVEIRAMDWTEAQGLVARGEADALIQINATEERRQTYDFSDPLLESHFAIFVRMNQMGISGISSLHGLRVGVESGGLPQQLLGKDPQITLSVIPSFPDGFRALNDGAIDAVVVDYRVGSYVLATNGIRNIKAAGDPISSSYSSIAVRKGNAALLTEIDTALQSIKADGTYQRIINAWAPTEGIFETQAQIDERLYYSAIVVLLVLLLIALTWAFTIRRQMSSKRAAEEKLADQYSTLRGIIEGVSALIFSVDRHYRYTSFNAGHAAVMQALYGADIEQGHSLLDYMTVGEDREATRRNLDRALAGEQLAEEAYSGDALRGRRYFRVSHSPIRTDDAVVGVAVLAQDLTERQDADEALRRLNRELRAISSCNQVLVRAGDEQALLDEICRIVCDEAGYRMAWVGYAENDDAKTVRPAAWAGFEDGYLDAAGITWADTERGRGPTGTAIRSGRTTYVQDFATDPLIALWRENALQRGYRSSIALPLKDDSATTFGALTIYSTEPSAFAPDEIRLLEELSGDLGFGITVLRTRAGRDQADEALRESEQRYREIFDNVTDSIFVFDVTDDGRFRFSGVNATSTRLSGVSDSAASGKFLEEIVRPEVVASSLPYFRRCVETGEILRYEEEYPRPAGGQSYLAKTLVPVRETGGSIGRLIAVTSDITDRKRAEDRVQKELEGGRILLELYDRAQLMADRQLFDYALDQAVRLTDSSIGFFHRVSDDQTTVILTTWNAEALKGCTATYDTEYLLDQAGNWADCVRLRRPIVYNDFPTSPNSKGLPPGHSPVLRFMSVPVLEGGKVRFIFGVGNKTQPYEDGDVVQLQLVASELQKLLERRRAEEKLRRSEARLREAQRITHIGSWRYDARTAMSEWSEESYRIFGMESGRPISDEAFLECIHPDDRAAFVRVWTAAQGGAPYNFEHRTLVDGKTKWIREQAEFTFDPAGAPIEAIGTSQDITERRLAEEELRASEERYRSVVNAMSEGIVLQDADGAIAACNSGAEAILGLTQDQMIGLTSLDPRGSAIHEDGSPFPGESHPAMVTLNTGEPCSNVTMGLHKPDGTRTWISINSQPLLRPGETKPYAAVNSFTDITERVAAEAERSRLLMAIEQIADSVMVTDLEWTIVYVNPSFARVYGYEPDEVVGRNAVILSSGRHDASLWEEIQDTIAAGRTWSGSIVNRRKDGTLVQVETVTSAIRDPVGRLASYVQADRDVTHERAMEKELATALRIRAAVAESLIAVRPGQDVPEIAHAICENVATVPQLDVGILLNFLAEDSAIVTAVHAPPGFPLHVGQALPPERSRYLYRRAIRGPWSARWKARVEDGAYGRAISASGLKASAYGPILYRGTPVGLLEIGTTHGEFAEEIATNAPALAEFSATSSALLAGPLDALARRERERSSLRQIIAGGAFSPVFQPIQDLATGEVVGYETLTRFTDGRRPDQRFESAWSLGLGVELELATLEKAATAAAGLPAGRWLAINMSPRLLQARERVAEIVRKIGRPVVIEITEHEVIEDYGAIREAVRAFGPNARISVDDAGAGVANFAHIIELRPDFVKLDMGLVRGVNVDLGRQALVIAMHHFSRTAGCRLVAEGVETEAEADTLAQHGVDYGQGYWFGRPQPVDALATAQPESPG